MKILFVATALDLPEAHLVRGLLEQGIDLRLMISSESKHMSVLDTYRDRVSSVTLGSRMDWRAMRSVRRMIREFSPDVIHSLSARALSNSLLASWGLPVKHVAYRGTMGNLSYWDPSSLISFLHPRLNRIICVSDAVKNDLEKLGVPASRLVRIYKGHDPAWYRIERPVSKSDLGIGEEQLVISCVANSRPVKGVDTLIQAFRLIPRDQAVQLLLVGEVRDNQLQEMAGDDPRIRFLGYRADAPAIVACSDIFCMPSRRREGFPKALLEAMIQGIPGVVTRVGGLPEMVLDGHNGLVVESEDTQGLAEALKRLAHDSNLRRQCGVNARERVMNSFPIAATIEQTVAVYRELFAQRPAAL